MTSYLSSKPRYEILDGLRGVAAVMVLVYQYVFGNDYTFEQSWPVALLVFVASLLTAYLSLKFYDLPVRKWLKKNW